MKKSTDSFIDHFLAWLEEESSLSENPKDASEKAIIRFSEEYSIDPPEGLKQTILQKIKSLQLAESNQLTLDINHLPILNADSNWLDWQTCVQHISPPDDYDSVFLFPLEALPERDLFVVWVKGFIEEEVHDDLVESFIILEGSCVCNIKKADGHTHVVRLTAGDYIEIPVNEPHNVIVTSLQPVKAILQWKRKVA